MNRIFLSLSVWLLALACEAQTVASQSMQLTQQAGIVPFSIGNEGVRQPVRWGIDTAWRWSWWPLRATNHMQECVTLGRVTLDPRTSGSYTELSSDQKSGLDEQLSWLAKSGVSDLYMIAGNASGGGWSTAYRTTFVNDLVLAVTYLRGRGYTVVGISPFNEPDYGSNNAPDAAEMATVARLMRANSTLSGVNVVGPSTLNPDYTIGWWDTMIDAVQMVNTHQLAGSFANFRDVYAKAEAAGKPSGGDEMHNIGDALIGMNHGLSMGIWWSDYGGYTRAELGRASNDGARIAYTENEGTFTSAAVFRRDNVNLAEAFMGGSERQAGTQYYEFVSQDRLVYYDGDGPRYEYYSGTPGGTGYSSGQTNAESVIEITYGEDVPVAPLNGNFFIVNKATGKALSVASLASNTTVGQTKQSKTSSVQLWNISPQTPGGDFAYSYVRAANNSNLYLDGVQYGGDNGARVLLYNGAGNDCERWHFRYMGNGYYVITNHHSGLSLEASSDNTDDTNTAVTQWARTGTDRQLWRLVPEGVAYETTAPAAPTGLTATASGASVHLSWTANGEKDLAGYMVYRYNDSASQWETLARRVEGTEFVDNMCAKGSTQRYRIRAIDAAWNISDPSAEVKATLPSDHCLMACYTFDNDTHDCTDNQMDAIATDITYVQLTKHTGASLNGTTDYVQLPYRLADCQEFTFSAWVRANSTSAWQRIFDFGSSTDNYMMLTTSNGSSLRFEICKNGVKQGVNATKTLTSGVWTMVTVTLGADGVRLYLGGELNASDASITTRPSDISPLLCYLGRSMFSADPLFKGAIGGVRIYNYALSDDEVQDLQYQDQIDVARELLDKPMCNDTRNSLNTAITELEETIATSGTGLTTCVNNLNTAIKTARTSIATYQTLTDILAWSDSLATAHAQKDAEAVAQYQAEYEKACEACTEGRYSDDEVADAIIAVRTFTDTYLMTDMAASASTTARNISYLLTNPDFATNTTDGWEFTSTNSYKGKTQYNCLEVSSYTFNLSQTLYGMPSGTYKLTTQAFYRNGAKTNAADTEVNTYLYMGDTLCAIAPISKGASSNTASGDWYAYDTNKYVPNDLLAASGAFTSLSRYAPVTSSNTLVADYDATAGQPLVIGLRKDVKVSSDWTVINYVKLFFVKTADGIDDLPCDPSVTTHSTAIYDLQGRKVTFPRRGLYIKDGKKILAR